MGKRTVFLLTSDVGGTNSRMFLYDTSSPVPLVARTYRNQEHIQANEPGVFEKKIIAPFLRYCWEGEHENAHLIKSKRLDSVEIIATLAIAGPVANNAVCLTNLHNIEIDGNAIANHIHCPRSEPYLRQITACKIINDFVAQGYGCLTLLPEEVRVLNPSVVEKVNRTNDPSKPKYGPKMCVGAGTGLGECYLTADDQGKYTCYPSEGGHVEFAPKDELEIKLWNFLKTKFDCKNRISVERVVSGPGLANCYEFLAQEFPDKVDKKVHEEFVDAGDLRGAVVGLNAEQEGSLCNMAMKIMMSAYGCEVGSCAIKYIPTGGMYVSGGLTPKNIKFMQGEDSPFMISYQDKGRVKTLLDSIPLYAVMVEDLGVRGAHKCAEMEYEKYMNPPASYKSSSSFGTFAQFTLATAVGAAAGITGVLLSKDKKMFSSMISGTVGTVEAVIKQYS